MTFKELVTETNWKSTKTRVFVGIQVLPPLILAAVAPFVPTPFSKLVIWGFVLGYFVRMLFITLLAHRYFSHGAMTIENKKVRKISEPIMAFSVSTCVQNGVFWWRVGHRNHHYYSDTLKDTHCARVYEEEKHTGFWWAHCGWILVGTKGALSDDQINALTSNEGVRWVERNYLIGPVALGAVYFIVGAIWNAGGFNNWFLDGLYMLLWMFLSTIALFHGTSLINSGAHKMGTRKYKTGDDSRNSFVLALFTLGEGWHNNHHQKPHCAFSGEGLQLLFDPTSWVAWLLELCGFWKCRRA